MGLCAGLDGSDTWPGTPAFCAVPVIRGTLKKNVPTEETGGGDVRRSGVRRHPALANNATYDNRLVRTIVRSRRLQSGYIPHSLLAEMWDER